MNYRFALACIAALAAISVSASEDFRKVAEQHERDFVKALKTKDMTWFQKVAAPDYHEIGVTGKRTNRAEAVNSMKQMFAAGKVTSATTKVLKVSGGAAKLTVLVSAHVAMEVKFDPKATKTSKLVSDMQMTEAWSKTGGKWLIHEIKTNKEKTTMDGKPMPGGM